MLTWKWSASDSSTKTVFAVFQSQFSKCEVLLSFEFPQECISSRKREETSQGIPFWVSIAPWSLSAEKESVVLLLEFGESSQVGSQVSS